MAEELDTSWFDLNKYEKLRTLDLMGWECQLTTRNWMIIREGDRCASIIEQVKTRPITNHHTPLSEYKAWKQRGSDERDEAYMPIFAHFDEHHKPWWHDPNVRPFNTYSVMNTPALYAWHHKDGDKPNFVTMDVAATDGYQGLDDRLGHITIDLTATDEQIKSDFSHWLAEYRKTISYESYKNNFTDNNLAEWVKWRLLPCIDLIIVSAFEKKSITNAKIGRLIFPDEYDVYFKRSGFRFFQKIVGISWSSKFAYSL